MELYYVHLISKYRHSENEPFGDEETDITYYDSLPHAVQDMKFSSDSTMLCEVVLACVGKAYISNHELCRDIPLFFCKTYDVTGNTDGISAFEYMKRTA